MIKAYVVEEIKHEPYGPFGIGSRRTTYCNFCFRQVGHWFKFSLELDSTSFGLVSCSHVCCSGCYVDCEAFYDNKVAELVLQRLVGDPPIKYVSPTDPGVYVR